MKTGPAEVRILVATDSVDDANMILRQLKDDFEHLRASTRPERSIQDFEEYQPHVLVLAFDSLDKAERYYLGLYRLGNAMSQQTHRAVILCRQEEVNQVFDLCKRAYFDDYVLYWPHSRDGPRLAMSIWIACREITSTQPRGPRPAELFEHAKHLADLERVIDHELSDCEQLGVRIGHSEAGGAEPMATWAHKFKNKLEPVLAGARELAVEVRKMRPIVLVVEDDDLTRQLISRTLDPQAWELVFVGDAPSALGMLRRMLPDVVLMDIRLPGVDGLALTRQLKANQRLASIPVIVMTGNAMRETLLHAMEVGAAEFVVKPFTRESLTGKMEKVFPR